MNQTGLELLCPDETAELQRHEEAIETGLQAAYASLLAIRDGRFYRATHATFEDYCLDRWGISRRRAYQLIDAAKVTENLCTASTHLPESEFQIRPLVALEPEQQREVWQEAVETAPNGKPTAKHVAEIAAKHKSATPNPEPVAPVLFAGAVESGSPESEHDGEEEDNESDSVEPASDPTIAARNWIKQLKDLREGVNSVIQGVERIGGFANLARGWPRKEVQFTVTQLQDLQECAARGIKELKGAIK